MNVKSTGILPPAERKYINSVLRGAKLQRYRNYDARVRSKLKNIPQYLKDVRLLIHFKNIRQPDQVESELKDASIMLLGVDIDPITDVLLHHPIKLIKFDRDEIVPSESFLRTAEKIFYDLSDEEILLLATMIRIKIQNSVKLLRTYKSIRGKRELEDTFMRIFEACSKRELHYVYLREFIHAKKMVRELERLGLINTFDIHRHTALRITPIGIDVHDTLMPYYRKTQ